MNRLRKLKLKKKKSLIKKDKSGKPLLKNAKENSKRQDALEKRFEKTVELAITYLKTKKNIEKALKDNKFNFVVSNGDSDEEITRKLSSTDRYALLSVIEKLKTKKTLIKDTE